MEIFELPKSMNGASRMAPVFGSGKNALCTIGACGNSPNPAIEFPAEAFPHPKLSGILS